ncbi:hypothetical protein P3342_002241 [Pyrenophora teres f. teres]|nr:hypothetical protein P3342_002241 [Pyrenophora teres f. teres]
MQEEDLEILRNEANASPERYANGTPTGNSAKSTTSDIYTIKLLKSETETSKLTSVESAPRAKFR